MQQQTKQTEANNPLPFIIYASCQVISIVGFILNSFAMGVWIYQQTGSVTTLAINSLAFALPGLLLAPLAGTLVDRWDRRRLMICCDAISALNVITLALLLWSGNLQTWHIYVTSAINSASLTFLTPAVKATAPLLIPKKHLARFNGFFGAGVAISQIIGPTLGGMLVLTIGVHGVLLIDFVTYLIGFAPLIFIRFPKPKLTAEAAAAQGSILTETAYGWNYIKTRPGLVSLLLFFAAFNFLVGIVNILFMPMLLSVTTPDILGMVISVGGVGMLIGTLFIGIWGGPKKRIWGVLGFFLGSGVFILLAGMRPWVPLFMVASFGFFFCQPIVGACAQTIFQTKVAHDVQGRFFALSGMVTGAATPLASIITGPLADRVFEPLLAKGGALSSSVGAWIGVGQGRGIGLMFILTGIGAILLSIGGIAYPHLRRLEDELPDVTPDHAPMETENVAPDA